jgi:hypothetical protein
LYPPQETSYEPATREPEPKSGIAKFMPAHNPFKSATV